METYLYCINIQIITQCTYDLELSTLDLSIGYLDI